MQMAEESLAADRSCSRFDALFAENYAAVRAYVARRSVEGVVDDVLAETFLRRRDES